MTCTSGHLEVVVVEDVKRKRVKLSAAHETSNSETKVNEAGEPEILPVAANGDDSTDPRSWSTWHRCRAAGIVWLLVFTQGWVSTCDSAVVKPEAAGYHVSEKAETLSVAIFMLGLAAGALFAGPLSETVGRNPVYLLSTVIMLALTAGAALAPNFGAQLAFRLLSGLASSPTLSVYGGALADLFDDEQRRTVWPWFAISPLLGPVLAPVTGGWIADRIDWRWTLWIGLVLAGAAFVLALIWLPETFAPVLLKMKAQHLRKTTGDTRFTAPLERGDPLGKKLLANLARPASFFTTEPIIIFLGMYLVFIFVINFTFLSEFEYIFEDTYGLSPGITSLNFLNIAVGVLIDVSATPLYTRLANRVHRRRRRAFVFRKQVPSSDSDSASDSQPGQEHSSSPPPELALIRAALAGPFLPISLFWLGWTNDPSISPASDYAATVLFGYAFAAIFISGYQYIINSYGTYSSSALGSFTVARYVVSAGMVVATRPMYEGIGVRWTSTLMGCLAASLVPVPWVLMWLGDRLRSKSKFASECNG